MAVFRYAWSSKQVLYKSPPAPKGFNRGRLAHPEFNNQYRQVGVLKPRHRLGHEKWLARRRSDRTGAGRWRRAAPFAEWDTTTVRERVWPIPDHASNNRVRFQQDAVFGNCAHHSKSHEQPAHFECAPWRRTQRRQQRLPTIGIGRNRGN